MKKRNARLSCLSLDLLVRSKYQPRHHFDPVKLQELANSIQSTGGLLQPIVVRALPAGKYEIIAGERRWRAAQLAGFSEVNCLVDEYTDEEALQNAIIENIIREDLNPIEEANAYQRLIDEFSYLHEEIASSVGKSRAAITNSLRLLKLVDKVQKLLIDGELSEGHGKILASLSPNEQIKLAQKAVEKNWNVRKLEAEIKSLTKFTLEKNTYADSNLAQLEINLAKHLGNRVAIQYETQGGGYLNIRFNNIDELEGHFERFGFTVTD